MENNLKLKQTKILSSNLDTFEMYCSNCGKETTHKRLVKSGPNTVRVDSCLICGETDSDEPNYM